MYNDILKNLFENNDYDFEIMNNGYAIDGCDYGILYYSKKYKKYMEIGYDNDDMMIYFKLVDEILFKA